MSDAIIFNNISKQYRLGLVSTRTLSHDLNRWWKMNILGKEDPYLKIGEVNDRASKGESEYVWALKDINFKVEQGDVLGIIGKNGAGKSTLLKILSKVTSPTTGTIKARGRIASLLEVGTGFHPEMTGRENIFMNGAIMGMTKSEIARKLDEIVDFAGVERYIDTPVKRYSSGMTVRLGFAIAAHLEPEILVVDEVLAVGDAEFQKKAIGKMQDVSKGEGRTVLFVSHNMAAIRSLCTTGVIMRNGFASEKLSIESAVQLYLQENDLIDLRSTFSIDEKQMSKYNIYILRAKMNSLSHDSIIFTGDDINIEFEYEAKSECVGDLQLGIYDSTGVKVSHVSTSQVIGGLVSFNRKGKVFCKISKLPLLSGRYYINVSLSVDGVPHFRILNAFVFMVEPGDFYNCGNIIHDNSFKFLLNNSWEFSK